MLFVFIVSAIGGGGDDVISVLPLDAVSRDVLWVTRHISHALGLWLPSGSRSAAVNRLAEYQRSGNNYWTPYTHWRWVWPTHFRGGTGASVLMHTYQTPGLCAYQYMAALLRGQRSVYLLMGDVRLCVCVFCYHFYVLFFSRRGRISIWGHYLTITPSSSLKIANKL